MFNKNGTRVLVIVAVVLGLIWFLADRFSAGSQQRTFDPVVLRLDTAAVTGITILSPVNGHLPLQLERTGAQEWSVTFNGLKHRASHTAVKALLDELRKLDADRVIGKLEAVKDRYGLNDSLVTRITITGNGVDHALAIGKYAQTGNNIFTYVNVDGSEEVLAVNGTIGSTANNRADFWRPRELVMGEPRNWQRLTFTYPADTGYVLERNGAAWLVDSMPADSAKVNGYLMSLAMSQAQNFADSVDVGTLTPLYSLKVEDSARPEPVLVQAYGWGYGFVITSSMNPGSVMFFDPSREMPRLFRPRHKWFPEVVQPH